jgi:hypothetical protein
MAFININTNNLSRQLKNATTFADNWVYVPGTAITGDYSQPYAFTSLDEFKKAFGTRGPEGSRTFEYVAGLLSAGLPVLFRRIARLNQDTVSDKDYDKVEEGKEPKPRATRAYYTITTTPADATSPLTCCVIKERFGGSYGNELSFKIIDATVAWWFEVYHNETLIEKAKIADVNPADAPDVKNQKLLAGLKVLQLDKVVIDSFPAKEDESKFILQEHPIHTKLSGGEDFDEGLVGEEIVRSYDFIYDKILYQPKFITAGGYTDSFTLVEQEDGTEKYSTPIADAMKAITKARQDCRALIDLPIGTAPGSQQNLAKAVAYQQLSDTQPIPSASVCAPWQYMQVGANQLWMPPSYAYLTVVGNALSKGGSTYTPKAGLTSGQVANIIRPEFEIGSKLSTEWQSDTDANINPIMRLQGGSYVIAGNSTLLQPEVDGLENNAFSESSADLTVIEIRRFVFNLATELQYQYNSTAAFETFSLRTAKFLEKMISEGAMSDYAIANVSTADDPRTLKIQLDVYLTPTIKKIEIFLNVAYGSIDVSTGGEA